MSLRQDFVLQQDLPEDCYREVAEKIAENRVDINQLLVGLLPLSQVNKTTQKAFKQSSFNFFMSHYSALPKEYTGLFILNKSSMTATHVRLGNQLTLKGQELCFQADLEEAKAVFIKAMSTYGSSSAMKILATLSKFTDKMPLNLDRMIAVYKKQEEIAIEREYKAAFPTSQHNDCAMLVRQSTSKFEIDLCGLNQGIFQVFKISDKSKENLLLLKSKTVERISDINFQESTDDRSWSYHFRPDLINHAFRVKFDANGFLGLSKRGENPWYEKDGKEQQLVRLLGNKG